VNAKVTAAGANPKYRMNSRKKAQEAQKGGVPIFALPTLKVIEQGDP
jgi:hypothetical protein